jgi:hypothetical protein
MRLTESVEEWGDGERVGDPLVLSTEGETYLSLGTIAKMRHTLNL